jgi:crotonobetainyl-CoA:carnitine CoA-transferase CaiB-like acyl-CoA transferase
VEFQAAQFAFTAANACRFSNESKLIDVSMYESLLALSQFTTVMWSCAGRVRSRHGSDFYWVVPSNLFRCADGWVYINTVPTFWDAITLFLELPELAIDPRFSDNDLRMQHRDALHQLISKALISATKREIRERATAARIPAGVVQTFGEVLADEHLAQRNYWQEVTALDGKNLTSPSLGFQINNRARKPLALQHVVSHEHNSNE